MEYRSHLLPHERIHISYRFSTFRTAMHNLFVTVALATLRSCHMGDKKHNLLTVSGLDCNSRE